MPISPTACDYLSALDTKLVYNSAMNSAKEDFLPVARKKRMISITKFVRLAERVRRNLEEEEKRREQYRLESYGDSDYPRVLPCS